MLELLLYCHMLANIKYAGQIAAVVAFAGRVKTRCVRYVAPSATGRAQPVFAPCWLSERDMLRSLDRLDAYVSSMA
jgi:hypothetical protein